MSSGSLGTESATESLLSRLGVAAGNGLGTEKDRKDRDLDSGNFSGDEDDEILSEAKEDFDEDIEDRMGHGDKSKEEKADKSPGV